MSKRGPSRKSVIRHLTVLAQRGNVIRSELTGAPVPALPAADRSCGDCVECCDCLGVEESECDSSLQLVSTGKPPGVQCEYASPGCRAYSRRPMSCRLYACWWRRGWGPEEARPDRLRVVVDDSFPADTAMLLGTAHETGNKIKLCMAAETEPGIFAAPMAPLHKRIQVIQELARERVVLLRYYGQTDPSHAVGPTDQLRVLKAIDAVYVARQQGRV